MLMLVESAPAVGGSNMVCFPAIEPPPPLQEATETVRWGHPYDVRCAAEHVRTTSADRWPKAAELINGARTEVLAFIEFPHEH